MTIEKHGKQSLPTSIGEKIAEFRFKLSGTVQFLADLYIDNSENDMSRYLNRYEKSLQRYKKTELQENPYEIGMLHGILDAYRELYFRKMEASRMDAEVERSLKGSRDTTLRILQVLYENQGGDEPITHDQLAREAGTTKQSLTNIMRRLEPSLAVRSKQIGKRKYYSLTDAGVRYYEKVQKNENQTLIKVYAALDELKRSLDLDEREKSLQKLNKRLQEELLSKERIIQELTESVEKLTVSLDTARAEVESSRDNMKNDRKRIIEKNQQYMMSFWEHPAWLSIFEENQKLMNNQNIYVDHQIAQG